MDGIKKQTREILQKELDRVSEMSFESEGSRVRLTWNMGDLYFRRLCCVFKDEFDETVTCIHKYKDAH